MEEIAVSKFKATCLAVLQEVRKTGRPILITRFGKPVAEVRPAAQSEPPASRLGCMAGTAEITGDIISPTWDESEWESLRS